MSEALRRALAPQSEHEAKRPRVVLTGRAEAPEAKPQSSLKPNTSTPAVKLSEPKEVQKPASSPAKVKEAAQTRASTPPPDSKGKSALNALPAKAATATAPKTASSNQSSNTANGSQASGAKTKPSQVLQQDVVAFDVGGKKFKVLTSVVKQKGGLLTELLEQTKQAEGAIFIDASPERFPFILDWYRHGQMFIPNNTPVAAALSEARFFKLPQEVIINGVLRSTDPDDGNAASRDVIKKVISQWPSFSSCLKRTLTAIRDHFHHLAAASANASQNGDAEEAYDFRPFSIALYGERGWVDERDLCSPGRARVLAMKLEERGY